MNLNLRNKTDRAPYSLKKTEDFLKNPRLSKRKDGHAYKKMRPDLSGRTWLALSSKANAFLRTPSSRKNQGAISSLSHFSTSSVHWRL